MVYAGWGNETVRSHDGAAPAAGLNGAEVAVTPSGEPRSGERTVSWRYRWATAPTTSCDVRLQGSMSSGEADAEWVDVDTSTTLPADTNWVQRTVDNVRFPFLRVRLVAQAGGAPATFDSEIMT